MNSAVEPSPDKLQTCSVYVQCACRSGDASPAMCAVKMGVFDAVQLSINVADQHALDEIVPSANAMDMGIIAKHSIANVAWNAAATDDPYTRAYARRLQALAYGMPQTEAAAIALRFTLAAGPHGDRGHD